MVIFYFITPYMNQNSMPFPLCSPSLDNTTSGFVMRIIGALSWFHNKQMLSCFCILWLGGPEFILNMSYFHLRAILTNPWPFNLPRYSCLRLITRIGTNSRDQHGAISACDIFCLPIFFAAIKTFRRNLIMNICLRWNPHGITHPIFENICL